MDAANANLAGAQQAALYTLAIVGAVLKLVHGGKQFYAGCLSKHSPAATVLNIVSRMPAGDLGIPAAFMDQLRADSAGLTVLIQARKDAYANRKKPMKKYAAAKKALSTAIVQLNTAVRTVKLANQAAELNASSSQVKAKEAA